MNFGRYQIDVDISAFPLWAFVTVAAVLLAFRYYRSTLPPVSLPLRRLSAILRAAAFIILLSLVFDPLIRFSIRHEEKPTLAVLADVSESMGIIDEKPRYEILKQLLRDPAWKDLENRFTIRMHGFSDGLSDWNGDSTRFDGAVTDIGLAISSLQKETQPPEAFLLLSDGAHNRGPDPLAIASGLPFPINSVVIGDSTVRPDLQIVSAFSNETVYTGKSFPIDVSVAGPGMAGRTVSVRLMRGDSLIEEKPVVIPASGFEASVRFSFIPNRPGLERLSIRIPKAEGETVLENNSRELAFRVLDSQIRVVVFADAPNPDLGLWSRLESRDANFRVMVRTAKANGGYYEGPMPTSTELSGADLIVLIDVPSRFFPTADWQSIRKSLSARTRPLCLIAGKRLDWEALRTTLDIVPFGKIQHQSEAWVPVRLTPEGTGHPLFADSRLVLEKLPPCFRPETTASWDPSFDILARFDEPAIGKESKPSPAILARSFGGRRTLVFTGSGWFRWALASTRSDDPFGDWVCRAARWLADRGGSGDFKVKTDRRVYHPGETVRVAVETDRQSDAKSLEAKLEMPSGTEPISLSGEGGLFSASVRAGQPGSYRVTAKWSGRFAMADSAEFAVLPGHLEFMDTRANPRLLSRLAEETGGRSIRSEQFSEFAKSLEHPPRIVLQTNEWQPSRIMWIWATAAVLLFWEWAIRRRKMMS